MRATDTTKPVRATNTVASTTWTEPSPRVRRHSVGSGVVRGVVLVGVLSALSLGAAMAAGWPVGAASTANSGSEQIQVQVTAPPTSTTTTTTTATSTTTSPPTTTTATSTTTTLPSGIVVVTNGSTVSISIGTDVKVSLVGFGPGSTVIITLNGVRLSVALTVGADGDLVVTFTVTDPHISVDGGTPFAANYGDNTITLTGTGPDGEAVTQSFIVAIPAPTTTTTSGPQTTTPGTSPAGTSPAGAPRGGGSSTTTGPVPAGPLAFTGFDAVAVSAAGSVLVGSGAVLVLAARRRRPGHRMRR